jgi:hypothetical protein
MISRPPFARAFVRALNLYVFLAFPVVSDINIEGYRPSPDKPLVVSLCLDLLNDQILPYVSSP